MQGEKMSWTLTTSQAILFKAGENSDQSAATSGAIMLKFSDEAEGYLTVLTRTDWITNYSTLNAQIKTALDDAASSIAANKLIAYNMDGYTSRIEAQTMLDVNADTVKELIAMLRDYRADTLRVV